MLNSRIAPAMGGIKHAVGIGIMFNQIQNKTETAMAHFVGQQKSPLLVRSLIITNPLHKKRAPGSPPPVGDNLEGHPSKLLITMVIVSPPSRVVGPLPNGLNGFSMGGNPNLLVIGMILQVTIGFIHRVY